MGATQRPAQARLASSVQTDRAGVAALTRLAAAQMIVGAEAHVPYGWSHALTLTQGALESIDLLDEPHRGVLAATYAGSFWAAYGAGPAALERALAERSRYELDGVEWSPLIAAALAAHDAHLVKYTLACVQCAGSDPDARGLYHAAAERLHRWWEANPPPDDPLTRTR